MAREAAAFRSAIPGAKPTFDFLPPEAGAPPDVVTLTLGQEFGTKASFEAAVLGYVRTHPGVAAWCDAARQTMPDRDRLAALEQMLAEIPSNAVPATLDAWPRPYRFLQLASIFAVQLSNGGVGQYFWNDIGALAPEAVEALRAMDLTRQAAAIERGIASFPPPYPLDATTRRHALRDGARGSDIARALDEFTDAADLDGIEPAMVAYARREGILPR